MYKRQISNSSAKGIASQPNHVVLLTCDAFGVMPPIAKLTPAQAMYHFLSGFTSTAAGTDRGVKEPEPTFSTCFAAPFLPRHPIVYGRLLKENMEKYNVQTWLINTGWSGGPAGVGQRMPIQLTRRLLRSALSGELDGVEMREDTFFKLMVPVSINGDASYLNPIDTWSNKNDFDKQAKKLVGMFIENFRNFEGEVDNDIISSGPTL